MPEPVQGNGREQRIRATDDTAAEAGVVLEDGTVVGEHHTAEEGAAHD